MMLENFTESEMYSICSEVRRSFLSNYCLSLKRDFLKTATEEVCIEKLNQTEYSKYVSSKQGEDTLGLEEIIDDLYKALLITQFVNDFVSGYGWPEKVDRFGLRHLSIIELRHRLVEIENSVRDLETEEEKIETSWITTINWILTREKQEFREQFHFREILLLKLKVI